jgi:Nucleolin binding domain
MCDLDDLVSELRERYREYSRQRERPFFSAVDTALQKVEAEMAVAKNADESDEEGIDERPAFDLLNRALTNSYEQAKAAQASSATASAASVHSAASASACTSMENANSTSAVHRLAALSGAPSNSLQPPTPGGKRGNARVGSSLVLVIAWREVVVLLARTQTDAPAHKTHKTRPHANTLTYSHSHSHSQPRTHTYTHTHTHIHSHTLTHSHARSHT